MTRQEINLLNFENELAAARQKLNNLIYEMNLPSDETTKKIMKTKIDLMTNELTHMETQLQLLKESLATGTEASNMPAKMPVMPQKSVVSPQAQVHQKLPAQPVIQPSLNQMPQTPPPTVLPSSYQKKPSNMEDIFGRNLMGILASVLILIGMVLFGTVVVPALSDGMKILCMYLISFLVTAAGMLFMKKSPANKFFISLTGLGAGGVFLSLIMSNVYFHLFGDLLTYFLLFVWAAGTIFLSRYEKKLSGTDHKIKIFEIIGQLGVMISVILGCVLCAGRKDSFKFLMLAVYHLIAVFTFHCSTVKTAKTENRIMLSAGKYKVQNHIFKLMNLWILILSYLIFIITPGSTYRMTVKEFLITFVFFMTLAVDLLTAYKEEKDTDFSHAWYHAFFIAYALPGVLLFLQSGLLRLPEILLSYALCVLLLLFIESQEKKYAPAAEIPLFCIILLLLIRKEASAGILSILLAVIPLMLIGMRKKNDIWLGAATASVYLWTFGQLLFYSVNLQTILAVSLCTVVYLYIRTKTENTAVRLFGYPIILIAVTAIFSIYFTDIIDHLIGNEIRHFKAISAFSIAGIFHIIMTKTDCFHSPDEKVLSRVINVILMLMGCQAISHHEIPFIPILIAVGVFTLNSRELLEEQEAKQRPDNRPYWVMAYITFKYTILLAVILYAFQTPEFLISISLLVFAVCSIIAGFWKKKKGYRLYGLVLSMISIFKLVMLDADIKDAVTGSVSFIICGLLCFAISFIYNKIQKGYLDDKER